MGGGLDEALGLMVSTPTNAPLICVYVCIPAWLGWLGARTRSMPGPPARALVCRISTSGR